MTAQLTAGSRILAGVTRPDVTVCLFADPRVAQP